MIEYEPEDGGAYKAYADATAYVEVSDLHAMLACHPEPSRDDAAAHAQWRSDCESEIRSLLHQSKHGGLHLRDEPAEILDAWRARATKEVADRRAERAL